MATTPTPSEQMMITLLGQIKDEIKKINSTASGGSQAAAEERKRNKSTRDLNDNLKTLERNTDNLAKSIRNAEKEFNKGVKIFNRTLLDVIKETFVPGKKIVRDAIDDFKDAMEEITDSQTKEYRQLAINTRDYIKTNKAATTNIKAAIGAHRDYTNIIQRLSRTQTKMSEEDEKHLKQYARIVEQLSEQMTGDKRTLMQYDKEQAKAFGKLQKGFKLTTDELNKIVPVLQEVGKNMEVIAETTTTYTGALTKSVTDLKKAMLDAVKGFVTHMKAAVVVAAPQVYKDIMAQAQNAVKQSDYSSASRLGVSQAELSEFVGQNRLALRSMGGGSSSAPIANGQINEMQNIMHTFGLTGNDALKATGTTIQNMVKMGIEPSVGAFKKQVDTLYLTMQQTGLSFEHLNNLVNDLSDSPAFLQLVQAKDFSGQTEQVGILSKMLATQFYSADYLKQLLELNKQQQYQGISEAVKASVGIQLLSGQINRTLGRNAVSQEDTGLLVEMRNRGGPAGLERAFNAGLYNDMNIGGQNVKDRFKNSSEFSAYALQKQLEINQANQEAYGQAGVTGNVYTGLVQKELLGRFGGMAGAEYQQMDAALQAQARKAGLTGTTSPTAGQTGMILGGAPGELVTSMNEVRNAFLPLGDATVKFAAALKEATDTLSKNPAGQAAGSLFGALKDLGSALLIWKGLGALKGFMPGAGGGLLSTLGGAASKAGGAIGGAAGWLGRGALAVGGSTGGLLAGSLAGGYGVGTLANNYLGGLWGDDRSLSGMLNDGMLRDRENAAVGQTVFPRPAGGWPYQTGGLKTKPEDLMDAPIVPAGDTMGDMMTNNNDKLNELVDLQKAQLDFTTKSHREYMDFVSGQDMNSKIASARRATRFVITGDAN